MRGDLLGAVTILTILTILLMMGSFVASEPVSGSRAAFTATSNSTINICMNVIQLFMGLSRHLLILWD